MTRQGFAFLTFALSGLLPACGSKAVDLDSSSQIIASDDPTVLGSIQQKVDQIAVDDRYLYWIGEDEGGGGGPFTLHSCDKQACASSLVTYNDWHHVSCLPPFAVSGGKLYWQRRSEQNVSELVASVAGDPQATTVLASNTNLFAMIADDDGAFYADGGTVDGFHVFHVPLAGTEGQQRLLATLDASVEAFAIQGSFLYWFAQTEFDQAAILRMPKDGSTAPETLVAGIEFTRPTDSFSSRGGLAVDAHAIYWMTSVLRGSINRCPLTGCAGAPPEVVAAPVRNPRGLRLDGAKLYFQYEADAYEYAISRCEADHCGTFATVASNVESINLFALDDQYLYTSTTTQSRAPDARWPVPSAQIRRLDK